MTGRQRSRHPRLVLVRHLLQGGFSLTLSLVAFPGPKVGHSHQADQARCEEEAAGDKERQLETEQPCEAATQECAKR